MSGSCPVSALVCRETARERDELRAEVERVKSDVNRYRGSAALYQRLMQEAASERDEARAEVERLRLISVRLNDAATLGLPHIYEGWCPDLKRPDERDPLCDACNALLNPTEGETDD